VGTIAKVEQDGGLPAASGRWSWRFLDRAVIGAGRTDLGDALWVEADRSPPASSPA